MNRSFEEWKEFDKLLDYENDDLDNALQDWNEERTELLRCIECALNDIVKINLIMKSNNMHPASIMESDLRNVLEIYNK